MQKKAIKGGKAGRSKAMELRVLILEDNAADAELMERQLLREKMAHKFLRTETRGGFLKALESFQPDVILADYTLPKFDAMQALKLARRQNPDIPFIVVTGSIGEEKAVACLRDGADDYLLKDRLARLGEAVRHAVTARRLQAERKDLHATIQQAAGDWLATFDAMNDAVCLLDADGAVRRCNQAMNRLLGLPFQRIIGRDCLELVCGKKKRSLCAFQRAKKSRRRQQEETLWRGRWYQVVVDPILGEKGRLAGAVHVMSDIHERKLMEATLRDSESRFRRLYEESPVAFQSLDPQGHFLDINPAWLALLGYRREEVIGRTFQDFLAADQADLFPGRFAEFLRKKAVHAVEFRMRKKDGGELIVSFDGVFLIDIHGRPSHSNCVLQNITERKQAEARIKASEIRYRHLFEESPVSLWEEDFSEVKREIERLKTAGVSDFAAHFAADERVRELVRLVRVLDVNRATLRLYECPGKEEFLAALPRMFDERSLAVFREEFLAIASGAYSFEAQIESQSLSGTPLTLILRWEVAPSDRGTLASVIVSLADITVLDAAMTRLHESQALLNRIAENIPNSYLSIIEGDLTIGFSSGQEFRKQNLDPARFVGKTIEEVFGEHAPAVRERYLKTFAGQEQQFELFINDQHQQYRTVPLVAEDGTIPRILSVVENISERKRAKEALLTSKAQLAAAMEIAKLGHWELDVASGTFTFSDELYAIFHTTAAEMGGYQMSIAEYSRRFVHPEDAPQVESETRKALETDDPHFNRAVEHRILYADGGEGHISVRYFIVKDAQGKTIKTYGVNQDISERKQIEKSLRESEQRYRQLVDMSPDAIAVHAGGKITFLNPAALRLCGAKDAEELLGKPALNMVHPDSRAAAAARIQRSLEQGSAAPPFNEKFVRIDGSVVDVEVCAVPIAFKGQPAMQVIIRDISERLRAEQALRESEERFRGLFENAAIGIYRTTPDGRIQMANPALLRMLGYPSLGELQERNLEEAGFAPDSPRGRFKDEISRLGSLSGIESAWKRKDGTTIFVRESAVALRDDAGDIRFYQGSVEDISQRKRAEDSLREMNEIFRQFLRYNPIYVFIKDENIRPVFLSDNFERMLGRPLTEIMGKTMDELFPSALSRQMIEDDKGILRDGAVREFQEELHGRIYSTIKFPIIIDGKAKYLAGYTMDITERTRAEELLRERDQLLQNLSAQIPGMIYTFLRRPDGRYALPYCSNVVREIFGVAPQEVCEDAAPIFAAIHPEDLPGVAASIEDSARAMTLWQHEFRVHKSGRPPRWMWARSQPFLLADGSILWYGFIADISERKQAEELLAASLREKEILLKEIHHRVKNNLQVISGLLTLQAGQAEDPRLTRMVRESQSRIWTMALIHQTLYQSGDLAGIDMADYIRTLAGNLLSSQARMAMPPSCRYDMEPSYLPIDQATPLALIVNELLTNALKHAFPDGRAGEIRIRLRRLPAPEGAQYELVVADDGVGLPADFAPGEQKHLGLQLIAMLARQIHGSLTWEQDGGARFRVRFPLAESNGARHG